MKLTCKKYFGAWYGAFFTPKKEYDGKIITKKHTIIVNHSTWYKELTELNKYSPFILEELKKNEFFHKTKEYKELGIEKKRSDLRRFYKDVDIEFMSIIGNDDVEYLFCNITKQVMKEKYGDFGFHYSTFYTEEYFDIRRELRNKKLEEILA